MRFVAMSVTVAILAGCSATTTTALPVRAGPPVAGNSVDAVISWIEAGREVPAGEFHTAEHDSQVTNLGDDVAFRMPGDLPPHALSGCMTHHVPQTPPDDRRLSCLVRLDNPPGKPEGARGQWIGGWVNFDGATVTVGGLHGDPGPFVQGSGRPLGYGQRLRFIDYQCRSDPTGLYCVNGKHHSAVLFGADVIAWGCTRQDGHPPNVGEQYDCSA